MSELAQVNANLQTLMQQFAELRRLVLRRRPLTRAEFCEATGLSYRTLQRKIAAKEFREVDGRIPAKYLDPYLT